MRKRLPIQEYKEGIISGDRTILSQALTLVESNLESDQILARQLLDNLMPYTGKSIRIAITGVPGAGKSSLLEVLGKYYTSKQSKVAVLAVDPTSKLSKGSILGDKTRMDELSKDPLAFIRPSPTGNTSGGIASATRESILLCEAAGFEIIFVETVGVGQIETEVYHMTDLFLLLMLTGAGDDLQMIKKGILELADIIVIHKADQSNLDKARLTQKEFEQIIHDYPETMPGWKPQTFLASSIENTGIDEIYQNIQKYRSLSIENGYYQKKRKSQNLQWMTQTINQLLESEFSSNSEVLANRKKLVEKVSKGELSAITAAETLFQIFKANK
jgi:LAO/AO transport system kinase